MKDIFPLQGGGQMLPGGGCLEARLALQLRRSEDTQV
jgi:hypothetical protein